MLKDSFKPEDDGKKKLRKSWSGDCNEKKNIRLRKLDKGKDGKERWLCCGLLIDIFSMPKRETD